MLVAAVVALRASASTPSASRWKRWPRPLGRRLVLAVDALAPLVALLRFDRKRCDRTRIKTLQADRLAGLLAVSIGAVLDPGHRRIDLGDQLALPVARTELERPLGLRGRAVGDIGMLSRIILEDAAASPVERMISSRQFISLRRK